MSRNYTVVHNEPISARILLDGQDRARLLKVDTWLYSLRATPGDHVWMLKFKVDNEIRPFSLSCFQTKNGVFATDAAHADLMLRIKDHIFTHGENFYSIGGAIPENATAGERTTGSKYICRLVNFPFTHLDHVDEQTKHQMKRYRGVAVAEFHGLGADGYNFTLYNNELVDIGLCLTASTYLLYTTR